MMNEFVKCFSSVLSKIWTALSSETSSTIIAGVVVFVICEWAKEVWLTPLQEFKKLKAKVSYALVMYAQYFANPAQPAEISEEYKIASNDMRVIASELVAFMECIPFIHLGIPSPKKIKEASSNLIGLSNSFTKSKEEPIVMHAQHIERYSTIIKKSLKLRG